MSTGDLPNNPFPQWIIDLAKQHAGKESQFFTPNLVREIRVLNNLNLSQEEIIQSLSFDCSLEKMQMLVGVIQIGEIYRGIEQ